MTKQEKYKVCVTVCSFGISFQVLAIKNIPQVESVLVMLEEKYGLLKKTRNEVINVVKRNVFTPKL